MRYTLRDVQEIAEKKGGICLSDKYVNNKTIMTWKCLKCDVVWNASFKAVHNHGGWCYKCTGNRRHKYTIDEINDIVKHKGECLSREYKHNKSSLSWRCACGYEWNASFKAVYISNQWCPRCAGNAKLTIEEMQEIAKERQGLCLSTEYVNINTKLLWKCLKCDHEWKAIPSSIRTGRWCPKCRESHGERCIEQYLKNAGFEYEREKRIPLSDWRFRFDFYLPARRIAIEYDGPQHFHITRFYTTSSDKLKTVKDRDGMKNKYCIENNITLIRIPYTEQKNIPQILDKHLTVTGGQ